ncbi:MAG TPA: protein kinase [Thermoanaerobaculia bacterium]|nr:protein kinase [Thermoanaerobaculia bacterium]
MERFGKYEILGEIGAGGFGTVYRGRDTILKRMVAIKTCSSEDDTLRLRFRREAEIVAGLQHPNITTIHDLGEQDGVPYLVQEFLDGEDLSHVIGRRDDISIDQRARLLYGVANGLAHAHAHGIIHRDIKPGNIRVLSNGSVKVMDFGIAKIGDHQTELTRTGMMLGTGPYLAPEQLTDEQLDSRCDIFSFGVVAYELFAYQRPFEASTFSALLYKILNQPHTPIREVCPDLPEPLVELVERCLVKDRNRRISSFEEIRSQLAQVLSLSEERKVPLSSSRVFAERTVAVDSGTASPRRAGGSQDVKSSDNIATRMLSSSEASAAAMRAAGAPGVGAAAPRAAAPATVSRQRPVPLIAASVAIAGLAIAGVVWLGGGEPAALDPTPTALESEAAPTLETQTLQTQTPPTTIDSATRTEEPASRVTSESPAAGAASEAENTARPTGGTGPAARPASGSSTSPPNDRVAAARTQSEPVAEPAPSEPTSPRTESTPDVRTTSSTSTPQIADRQTSGAHLPDRQTAILEPPSNPAAGSQTPTTAAATPPEPAAAPAPTTAPAQIPQGPDPAADEAGIEAALERYRKAYEALDIRALAAAWPSLDSESRTRIDRGFASYQALSMTIEGCTIDITGSSALARCTVHQEVAPKGGRRLTSDREVEFRLSRRGDSWVIQSL